MAALANKTSSKTRSYNDFIDRSRFPEMPFQRVEKEPGSKELIFGRWVIVEPDGEDVERS